MKKIFFAIAIIVLFGSGCSLVCQMPEKVRRNEELQYEQALRINVYLREVNQNPDILRDPKYGRLNEAILGASTDLVGSTRSQSEWLGHTKEFKGFGDEGRQP